MKVALVYDRVNKWGGAERVLLALHRLFPEAPLYTSVYDKSHAGWADVFKVYPSFLQQIPFAKKAHEYFALFMPVAFESFNFDEYDVVISVTSEAAKGVITKPGTLHICYCLTPTRYLWSGYSSYFNKQSARVLTMPAVFYLRSWDKQAASRPDVMVSISDAVSARVRKYYGRDSEVIYPPLAFEVQNQDLKLLNNDGYFLLVSRLSRMTPHKRVEIAIKAANTLGISLKIVGEGKDISYFKRSAKENVEFLGLVSDEELVKLYRNSTALIFPGVEDFGLVMAEAQLFGKPVIAYRAGGAKEIVKEGVTGEFFDKPTASSLIDVLKNFNAKKYNSKICSENGQRFSFQNFEKQFLSLVDKSYKEILK